MDGLWVWMGVKNLLIICRHLSDNIAKVVRISQIPMPVIEYKHSAVAKPSLRSRMEDFAAVDLAACDDSCDDCWVDMV